MRRIWMYSKSHCCLRQTNKLMHKSINHKNIFSDSTRPLKISDDHHVPSYLCCLLSWAEVYTYLSSTDFCRNTMNYIFTVANFERKTILGREWCLLTELMIRYVSKCTHICTHIHGYSNSELKIHTIYK